MYRCNLSPLLATYVFQLCVKTKNIGLKIYSVSCQLWAHLLWAATLTYREDK